MTNINQLRYTFSMSKYFFKNYMKRKIIVLIYLLCLMSMLIFVLTACDFSGGQEPQIKQLETPSNVRVSKLHMSLHWNYIDGASGFEVRIGEYGNIFEANWEPWYGFNFKELPLIEGDEYNFFVRAISDSDNLLTSEWSAPYSFVIPAGTTGWVRMSIIDRTHGLADISLSIGGEPVEYSKEDDIISIVARRNSGTLRIDAATNDEDTRVATVGVWATQDNEPAMFGEDGYDIVSVFAREFELVVMHRVRFFNQIRDVLGTNRFGVSFAANGAVFPNAWWTTQPQMYRWIVMGVSVTVSVDDTEFYYEVAGADKTKIDGVYAVIIERPHSITVRAIRHNLRIVRPPNTDNAFLRVDAYLFDDHRFTAHESPYDETNHMTYHGVVARIMIMVNRGLAVNVAGAEFVERYDYGIYFYEVTLLKDTEIIITIEPLDAWTMHIRHYEGLSFMGIFISWRIWGASFNWTLDASRHVFYGEVVYIYATYVPDGYRLMISQPFEFTDEPNTFRVRIREDGHMIYWAFVPI